jgi:hypothetical protein
MKQKISLLLILLSFNFCIVEDASINMMDAYSELYSAIEYKYKECGNKPDSPLIPPEKSNRNSLKLCTLSILRMNCPFKEYPITCYDLFLKVINK